jgi:hypothetical protein
MTPQSFVFAANGVARSPLGTVWPHPSQVFRSRGQRPRRCSTLTGHSPLSGPETRSSSRQRSRRVIISSIRRGASLSAGTGISNALMPAVTSV